MYKPQRVHPMAILQFTLRTVYSLGQGLIPLLLIAFAQPEMRRWLFWGLPLLLAFMVAYGILYWLCYVFYISGQELRVEYGVLIKKKRYIPFERIQTIQISAGILHRMFGLVKVQVETAGGGSQAEFVLAALPRDIAAELQHILQEKTQHHEEAGNETEYIEYKLSTRSLLVLASTSNGIGIVLSAILAVISQLDDFFPKADVWGKFAAYAGHLAAGKISLIILVIFLIILLAWLLSLLGTIIQFGGFQLRREGNNIIISRGLFEKHQMSIPIKRIQAIKVVEGLLRQPLGMVSLQVVSMSTTGMKEEGNVLFPILPRAELAGFVEKIAPEFTMSMKLHGLPARSKWGYLLINTIPALIIAVLCTVYLPWGYVAFILPLLGAALGNAQYNDAGYQVENNRLLLRSRHLGRVTFIIPKQRVQSMHVSQNPLQARGNLSNLRIAVASSNAAATVQLRGMDIQKSSVIMKWLFAQRH